MDIPLFVFGVVMICVGILIIIRQIKRFKNELNDEWGYEKSTVISRIGVIVMGIIVIVKSF
jgi:hypothetical protein